MTKPCYTAQCDICDKQTVLVWRIRNRNSSAYEKRVCGPCGMQMLHVDSMYVEEMPYLGVEERWPVKHN